MEKDEVFPKKKMPEPEQTEPERTPVPAKVEEPTKDAVEATSGPPPSGESTAAAEVAQAPAEAPSVATPGAESAAVGEVGEVGDPAATASGLIAGVSEAENRGPNRSDGGAPTPQVCLACQGSGFTKSEINDMMLAYEIARQRNQQMTQVKKERDDKKPDDPSGDPSGDGSRLDECLTLIQGSCQFVICEVCCGKCSEVQQACRKLGIQYIGIHADMQLRRTGSIL